jgi:hypothetical protein
MPSVRALRIAAVLAAGFAAVRLVGYTALWLLPYNLAGVASEAGLLLIAIVIGVAVLRWWPVPTTRWPIAALAAAVSYVALSFAGLGWNAQEGFGFARNRFYVFSAPGCDFVATFPSPPEQGHFGSQRPAPLPVTGGYAWLSDLDSVSSLRADCLVFDAPFSSDQRWEVADKILHHWVSEDRVQVGGRLDAEVGGVAIVQIRGSIGGSVLPETAESGPRRTLVVVRARASGRSVLVLSAHQSLDPVSLSRRSWKFLASGRLRGGG